MKTFAITNYEINTVTNVRAQGVAEAMFDYLPWPTLDISIKFINLYNGWEVTDNKTDFRYRVDAI